jgi:small subunit ribosomal protein S17
MAKTSQKPAEGKTGIKQSEPAAKAKEECTDKNCPVHGMVRLHGRKLQGTVISAKAHKTVTVERVGRRYIKKYERYGPSTTKVLAHNPSCINAKQGDVVVISETRPLSKTKHFVVTEVVGAK